jgi:GAF domain-containing protein
MSESREPLGSVVGAPEAEQLRFLAAGGAILEGSLDFETTLKELGQLVVPALADWYAVDLVDPEGRVTNIAVAHVDPTKVELAADLRRRYPPDPDAATGVLAVVRTGRPEFFPDIPPELIDQLVEDPELRKILTDLGLRSAITVPLAARGQTLGALTVITAESDRRYGPVDVQLVEELAKRAGLAIDNARLMAAERRANQRIELIARVSSVLAESFDEGTGLLRLAELVTEGFADFCLIDVLEEDGSVRRARVVHRDPDRQHVVEGLQLRPPAADGPAPAAIAMRTRQPFVAEVSEQALSSIAADQEHLDLMRQIGGRNLIAAPLVARDRVLGALTVSSLTKTYGEEDVQLAAEIANRAALHLDNARLFLDQANAARQARRLQAIVDAAFISGTLEELLRELLERVRQALGTDLAAILLMEEEEPVLRMRSEIGIGEETRRTVRVPLGEGFAGVIAARRQPLVVEHTHEYPVVSPYLRERVQSVVGVPLLIGDEVIGVLHTSTVEPRQFGADEIALLQLAAQRAAVAIRQAELYERQLEIATVLQRSLLPRDLPEIPGLELAVSFRAAGRGVEVGGDFYDAFALDDGAWALVVGDVCGRGPEAAAVTSLARNATRTVAMQGASPSEVLARVNEVMIRSATERFCTAVIALIRPEPSDVEVTIARAGHPPPLIRRAGGTVEEVLPTGALLGVFDRVTFDERAARLAPGDALVLYTDGLIERQPAFTGREALAAMLAAEPATNAGDVVRAIEDRLGPDTEAVADDVVVMVIRATAPGGGG